MEEHALSAVQIHLKKSQAILFALPAYQTLSLQLVVSQTPRVNVTLGTRGQMEALARSAVRANTKWDWGLPFARHVH